MRNLTVTLALLAMSSGCAYQQAMQHGETAAAAQDWEAAAAAYRFANDIKPGGAEAELAATIDSAVETELEAAGKAVERGEYTEAAAHLDEARHLNAEHPRIAEVQQAATDALLVDLADRMEGESDIHDKYAFVAIAKQLAPESPQVEDASASLRDQVQADVLAQLEADQHAKARNTAALIAELEPEQATLGAQVEGRVTEAWVESLAARAKRSERYRPGLAAVYWARAHEVGGADEHLEASKTFLQAAAPKAPVRVFLDTKGSGGRHWTLRKELRADLEDSVGVGKGWGSSWDLKAVVSANNPKCTETSEEEPHTKEYVAGTKQVPNPEYGELDEKLGEARTQAKDLAKKLEESKSELGTASAEAKALEGELARKDKLVETAKKAMADTEEQISASADRVKEAETHLASLEGSGEDAAIDEAKEKLELVQGFHADWTTKKTSDEEALAAANSERDAVKAELEPLQAEVERLTAVVSGLEGETSTADQAVVQLQAKLEGTEPELTEDVMDTAEWADTTWTLTCEAPATVHYATRWDTERDKKQEITLSVTSTDLSRPGHEGAEIEEDPKEYPKSKEQLLEELAKSSHDAIAKELEAFVVDNFETRIAEALADTEDVDKATDTLVSIVAGAPERVTEDNHRKLEAYLLLHHGLENPSHVGVGAVAAKAEPAEEGETSGEETSGEEATDEAEPATEATDEGEGEQAAADTPEATAGEES
jgi:hypothetical protein